MNYYVNSVKIRIERAKLNLDKTKFAKAANMDRHILTWMENNPDRTFSLRSINKLSYFLKIEPEDIIVNKEDA